MAYVAGPLQDWMGNHDGQHHEENYSWFSPSVDVEDDKINAIVSSSSHSPPSSLMWKQQQRTIAARNWQHPLDTVRPSTTSSEYGRHTNRGKARLSLSRSMSDYHSKNNGAEEDAGVATVTMTKSASAKAQERSSTAARMPDISSPSRQSRALVTGRSLSSNQSESAFGAAGGSRTRLAGRGYGGDSPSMSRASTSVGTSRRSRGRGPDTVAANFLRSRASGKSYAHSPKFAENRRTWQRIGYGEKGVATDGTCDLYQADTARRRPLRRAPLFPTLENSYGDVYFKAVGFQRPEKGVSDAVGIPGQSAWEHAKGFVPRQIKQGRIKQGQRRIERKVSDTMQSRDLADEERIVAKTKQRLSYLQAQMESQGYLDRQRGVGVGKGLLRSQARRAHRGGHQVAKLVRGNSPWLGE